MTQEILKKANELDIQILYLTKYLEAFNKLQNKAEINLIQKIQKI